MQKVFEVLLALAIGVPMVAAEILLVIYAVLKFSEWLERKLDERESG